MPYKVKEGFNLFSFWVEFVKSERLAGSVIHTNGVNRMCVALDVEDARRMIEEEFDFQSVELDEIRLHQPNTTKNSDLKYLNAKGVLGFTDGYIQWIKGDSVIEAPKDATHEHSLGSIQLFYRRVANSWFIWRAAKDSWIEAGVNTVNTLPDGTPRGFIELAPV